MENKFTLHCAGRVPLEHAARQVGFMSTQKRVSRWHRLTCMERAGRGSKFGSLLARQIFRAIAGGTTAPLVSMFWSVWAWMATKLLRSDRPFRQLVTPVRKVRRRGSPPLGVNRYAAFGKPVCPRSSLPHSPLPSGIAWLRRILPQALSGTIRQAERYDGQRDMYFEHAA